jgi:membrane protease YdiL (CAAX protease family)
MERSVPLVLLIIGVFIAFWAGGKWRHYQRSWADHRAAKEVARKANAVRWLAFQAAWVAVAITLLYLVASGAISATVIPTGQVPAQLETPGRPSSTR